MICKEIRELMSNYIDKDLNDFDKVRVEKHCEECSYCQKDLNDLKSIVHEIKMQDEYEVPYDLRDNIRNVLLKKSLWGVIKEVFLTVPAFRLQAAGVVLSAFLILVVFAGKMDELLNSDINEHIKTADITVKSKIVSSKVSGIDSVDKIVKTKQVNKNINYYKSAKSYESNKRRYLLATRETSKDVEKGVITKDLGIVKTESGFVMVRSPETESFCDSVAKNRLEEKVAEVVKANFSSLKSRVPKLSENFIISGKVIVKNKKGRKITTPGAKITITTKDGASPNVQNVYTDKKGKFTAILNNDEKYDVNVVKKGYKEKTISNLNNTNYDQTKEIVLEK